MAHFLRETALVLLVGWAAAACGGPDRTFVTAGSGSGGAGGSAGSGGMGVGGSRDASADGTGGGAVDGGKDVITVDVEDSGPPPPPPVSAGTTFSL